MGLKLGKDHNLTRLLSNCNKTASNFGKYIFESAFFLVKSRGTLVKSWNIVKIFKLKEIERD